MEDCHRTNVLVTSCLKTPVDPQTKVPLASYERRALPPFTDSSDREPQPEFGDSGSEFCDGDSRLDLSGIFFSNEEYYGKLEELKKAHLRTMAELESMYHRKQQCNFLEPCHVTTQEAGQSSPALLYRLRRSYSAVELRRCSGQLECFDEDGASSNNMEKSPVFSPKEHIKNMWRDFKLTPTTLHLSTSSLQSLPGQQRRSGKRKVEKKKKKNQCPKDVEQEDWKHRMTVPKPFQMTLREAERRKHGIKTRSEIEQENAELRRQLEELTECQRKFRASPVPIQLQERRLNTREQEERRLQTVPKPFSFLERERLKREQKEQRQLQPLSDQERVKPFKAKPVPKSVYAAASGELMKEEQLYRSIKTQMRAEELLHSASMPISMLERRLSERKKNKDEGEDSFTHQPQINKEVPDFNASYRRFQRHLEKRREVKVTTMCEPFDLKTSQIPSHRERILADIEKDQQLSSPKIRRWPPLGSGHTPTSSLCSSLSGSLELIPAKVTDATKKRHEAVRKVLEQRKRVEEQEERWQEKQKQREKKLQRVVLKKAQANDPHLALSQTQQTKLTEFRKQDLQRRREYQDEIREIEQRVKQRPLLLEQVAQSNARQAAERRYTNALQGWDATHQPAAKSTSVRRHSQPIVYKPSDNDTTDMMGYMPVCYRKIFLDDDDVHNSDTKERGRAKDEDEADKEITPASTPCFDGENDHRESDDSDRYSSDHESYSDESDAVTGNQEAGD